MGCLVRTTVRTAGIIAHRERPVARKLAAALAADLADEGVEVRMPRADAMALGLDGIACDPALFARDLGFVLALGGDGTILRAVDMVVGAGAAGAGVPVLGVNVGQLGYLAEVEPCDLDEAVARILAGDYVVEERMLLSIRVESAGATRGSWLALNEAVLEKARAGTLVRLAVSINGSFFTTYAADGVIVATPTGSTAYSFSARGPIVSPRHHSLVLTPVSPHMLFDRSLVLGPEEELSFEVLSEGPVHLVFDGREAGELRATDTVACTSAPQPARFITFTRRDFHQVLKAKFGLADR